MPRPAKHRRLTAKEIAEARRLRGQDWMWPEIAARYGISYHSARLQIDVAYREKKRQQARGKYRETLGVRPHRGPKIYVVSAEVKADAAARLAEIPPDTRSPTAVILGDPLPGRSALDMERAAKDRRP